MDGECAMYAIMLKKGRGRMNALMRPWKERLIVLHPETMKIAYYTIPSASCDWAKRGELSIVRCGVTCIPSSTSGKVFTFQITSADGELLLSAATATQRDEWIQAITSITSRHNSGGNGRERGGILTLPHAYRKRPVERKALMLDFADEISPSPSFDTSLSSCDYSRSSCDTRSTLWSFSTSECSTQSYSLSPIFVNDSAESVEAIPRENPPDYTTFWEIYTENKRLKNKELLLELKNATAASQEEEKNREHSRLSLYLNMNKQQARCEWQPWVAEQSHASSVVDSLMPCSPRTC